MMMKDDKRVCVGAFAGAHGVQGDAKMKAFTSDPAAIADYGPVQSEDGKHTYTLKFIRILKNDLVLVRSKQITSREIAAQLAGTRVYVAREELPAAEEEEFYFEDLIGLEVHLADGTRSGEIVAVHNFGAGDIIEIKKIPNHKGAHLVPFSLEAIPDVKVGDGYVVLSSDFLPANNMNDDNQEEEKG